MIPVYPCLGSFYVESNMFMIGSQYGTILVSGTAVYMAKYMIGRWNEWTTT